MISDYQEYAFRAPDGQAAKSIGVLQRDSSYDTGDFRNGRCQIPNTYASTVYYTIKKIIQIVKIKKVQWVFHLLHL